MTVDAFEVFLFEALKADSDLEYQRVLMKHCGDIKNGEQNLRRRANRRTDFHGEDQACRCGEPFTYTENKILVWAVTPSNEGNNQPIDFEYIARLVQRTQAEILAWLDQRNNTRSGVQGFDL